MKFVIETVKYFETYCDDCGWEAEAETEYELGLKIDAHIWWAHEGESAEYDY